MSNNPVLMKQYAQNIFLKLQIFSIDTQFLIQPTMFSNITGYFLEKVWFHVWRILLMKFQIIQLLALVLI